MPLADSQTSVCARRHDTERALEVAAAKNFKPVLNPRSFKPSGGYHAVQDGFVRLQVLGALDVCDKGMDPIVSGEVIIGGEVNDLVMFFNRLPDQQTYEQLTGEITAERPCEMH